MLKKENIQESTDLKNNRSSGDCTDQINHTLPAGHHTNILSIVFPEILERETELLSNSSPYLGASITEFNENNTEAFSLVPITTNDREEVNSIVLLKTNDQTYQYQVLIKSNIEQNQDVQVSFLFEGETIIITGTDLLELFNAFHCAIFCNNLGGGRMQRGDDPDCPSWGTSWWKKFTGWVRTIFTNWGSGNGNTGEPHIEIWFPNQSGPGPVVFSFPGSSSGSGSSNSPSASEQFIQKLSNCLGSDEHNDLPEDSDEGNFNLFDQWCQNMDRIDDCGNLLAQNNQMHILEYFDNQAPPFLNIHVVADLLCESNNIGQIEQLLVEYYNLSTNNETNLLLHQIIPLIEFKLDNGTDISLSELNQYIDVETCIDLEDFSSCAIQSFIENYSNSNEGIHVIEDENGEISDVINNGLPSSCDSFHPAPVSGMPNGWKHTVRFWEPSFIEFSIAPLEFVEYNFQVSIDIIITTQADEQYCRMQNKIAHAFNATVQNVVNDIGVNRHYRAIGAQSYIESEIETSLDFHLSAYFPIYTEIISPSPALAGLALIPAVPGEEYNCCE